VKTRRGNGEDSYVFTTAISRIKTFLFLQRGGAPLYYDHYLVGPVEEREGNIYVNYNLAQENRRARRKVICRY
jgi:hypothetical protein